jgi:hypothetical protein
MIFDQKGPKMEPPYLLGGTIAARKRKSMSLLLLVTPAATTNHTGQRRMRRTRWRRRQGARGGGDDKAHACVWPLLHAVLVSCFSLRHVPLLPLVCMLLRLALSGAIVFFHLWLNNSRRHLARTCGPQAPLSRKREMRNHSSREPTSTYDADTSSLPSTFPHFHRDDDKVRMATTRRTQPCY